MVTVINQQLYTVRLNQFKTFSRILILIFLVLNLNQDDICVHKGTVKSDLGDVSGLIYNVSKFYRITSSIN